MFGSACRLVCFLFFHHGWITVGSPICKWNVWVRAVTWIKGSDHQKRSNSESLRQFYLLFCNILQCDASQLQLGLVGPPDAWSNLGHLAGWSPIAGDISAVKLDMTSRNFSHIFIHGDKTKNPYFIHTSVFHPTKNVRRIFFSMGLLWTISYELIIYPLVN